MKNKSNPKNSRQNSNRRIGLVWPLLLLLIFGNFSNAFAFQAASPYPVIEGSPNSQEINRRLQARDIQGDEGVYFVLGSSIMTLDANSNFRPNAPLTEAEALVLAINSSGMASGVKVDPSDWRKGYIDLATSSGVLNPQDIVASTETNYSAPVTAEKFARWMSASSGKPFIYSQNPSASVNRRMAAQMLHSNKNMILSNLGSGVSSGEVVSKQEVYDKGEPSLLITVKSDEGGFFNVLANSSKNFPVARYGALSLNPSVLQSGDRVEFFLRDGKVYYAQAGSSSPQTVEGTFEGIQGSNIIIKDFTDRQRIYQYSPNATFFTEQNTVSGISSKQITKENLIYGQDIRLMLKNNIAEEIHAYLDIDPDLDGYIPPKGRMVSGKVLEKGNDYLVLSDNQRYAVPVDTLVSKGGILSDISYLMEGDMVKLFFDDIYSQRATALEIEGPQRQIDKLLKGTIDSVAIGRGTVTLTNVKELSGDRWIDAGEAYKTIPLSNEIYVGSQKVNRSQMSSYKGQSLYMAVSMAQGSPKVEKGNIMASNPISLYEEVRSVDYPGSYMNVDGNIINFSGGTLVVKDSRLVDSRNIDAFAGAFVEASSSSKAASLVVLNTTTQAVETGYAVYRGTFENVFNYKFALYNDKGERFYYINTGDRWITRRAGTDDPQIAFTDQTRFYDADHNRGEGKVISVNEIKDLRFTDRRDDNSGLLERQVYVVTRNDVAIGVTFQTDTSTTSLVNAQNTMTGRVREIGENTVTLREVAKFNSLRGIFVHQQLEEEIDLSKAIIVKDGKAIPLSAIEELNNRKVRVIYKQRTTRTNDGIVLIVE
ncbi:hypothetical protein J2Z35_000917 [Acetoanaerobium pronyense]|uniref:SLH domain-containing protein n=1 Tax=Acetoanaerobium pronyense TaxID=1482736 RepID=A0ABS4KH75_9FIRM|nr:hypothetical protein [Acetoanaerobium pronyense]MBP2027123.1 hypothetical protein [Acetoanaerobium pronyense]